VQQPTHNPAASPSATLTSRGGTYYYNDDISSRGSKAQAPSRELFRLVVEPRKGGLQRISRWDRGPTEPTYTQTLSCSATQLLLTRSDSADSPYDYQPPVVELMLPLRDGARWSGKTRARSDTETYSNEIKSHKVEDVPGYGRLSVWRIVETATIDIVGVPGATRRTYVRDTSFAPGLFVPIKQVTISKDYDGSDLLVEEHSTRTLQPP
jgi:hypothetical protein